LDFYERILASPFSIRVFFSWGEPDGLIVVAPVTKLLKEIIKQ